jgi:hypothetical protein
MGVQYTQWPKRATFEWQGHKGSPSGDHGDGVRPWPWVVVHGGEPFRRCSKACKATPSAQRRAAGTARPCPALSFWATIPKKKNGTLRRRLVCVPSA